MDFNHLFNKAFPPFHDSKREKPREMLYVANETPDLPIALVAGAQHALVALMAVVYAVLVGEALNLKEAELTGFLSLEIAVMGIATLMQSLTTRFSSGHLIAHVPSTVSFVVFITVATTFGLSAAAGGLILAGIVSVFLSRFLSRLRVFFPPEISGVLLVLVGLSVITSGVTRFTGFEEGRIDLPSVLIASATLGSIIAFSVWTSGRLRVFAVVIGAAAGMVLASLMGRFGAEEIASVVSQPFVAFPLSSYQPPVPSLILAAAMPLVLVQLLSSVDAIGAGVAIDKMNNEKWRRADLPMISRLVCCHGIGVVLNGLTGTPSIGASSANLGLAHASGVAARRVGSFAGIFLILMAFLPQVSAFVIHIPQPVVGAIVFYTAGYMLVTGMELILSRLLNSRRRFMVGVSITLGASLLLVPELAFRLPEDLRPIFGSGLMVGSLSAIAMNIVFRIGISQRGQIELAGPYAGSTATTFLEDHGAAWGARRDVVTRAGVALGEALEALHSSELLEGPLTLQASFDEYKLILVLHYPGRAITFSEVPKVDLNTLLDAGEDEADAALDTLVSSISGHLIKNLADHVSSSEHDGRAQLRFQFDH